MGEVTHSVLICEPEGSIASAFEATSVALGARFSRTIGGDIAQRYLAYTNRRGNPRALQIRRPISRCEAGPSIHRQNAKTLGQFSVNARVDFDGNDVFVVFQSGPHIGAFPLISPVTGKPEITLVVRPRFGWTGLGRVLGTSGFKVIPQVLSLPLLPKTEREIPDWILSATVLPRLKALLAQLSRRFEIIEDVRSAPHGQVNWANYVTEKLPAMKFLEVPCRHPDLRNDRELTAAIHYVLRKQLASLESQRHAGTVVVELLQICVALLRLVQDVLPMRPTRKQLDGWFRMPFATSTSRVGWMQSNGAARKRGSVGPQIGVDSRG